MDSDNINSENRSLPEIFLQPSKKLLKVNLEVKSSRNIWNDINLNPSAIHRTTTLDLSSNNGSQNNHPWPLTTQEVLSKQHKHSVSKEMRGETPGSDAPSNSPPLIIGNKNNFVASAMEYTEENVFDSESDSFIWAPEISTGTDIRSYSPVTQRRSVEGADSNGDNPSLPSQISNISDFQEMKYMQRKSPAGVSTPEILPNTTSRPTNIGLDGPSYACDPIPQSVRPPALGQSEDVQFFIRKDLGSSDGEDSSHESIKELKRQVKKKPLIEGCSVGSQSENTDSTNTVLDLQREPIQGCEDIKTISKLNMVLSKPNFIVGGAISPRTSVNQMGNLIDVERSIKSKCGRENSNASSNQHSSLEQEESLLSKISVESTHPPDSTECITSPSGISVSSIASSKKLEWDSGADVGYSGKSQKEKLLTSTSLLSTLERIAIGNYASVIRSEPEGKGTNIKKKLSKKGFLVHKDGKASKISESKFSPSARKTFNKEYCHSSLNQKRIVNEEHGRLYLSTDEENWSVKQVNSQKRRSKKAIDHAAESHNEVNSTINQLAKHNCKKKASKLMQADSLSIHHQTETLNAQSDADVLSKVLHKTLTRDFLKEGTSASLPSLTACKERDIHESKSLDLIHAKLTIENVFSVKQKETAKIINAPYQTCGNEKGNVYFSNQEFKNLNDATVGFLSEYLLSLSKKLDSYVSNLIDIGTFEKIEDHKKLQEYISFIGQPSANEEEVHLKKSVADIILRMFGDITEQNIESFSSTLNTGTEEITNEVDFSQSSSIKSKSALKDDVEFKSDKEENSFEENEILYKEGNIIFVPYRPPSATRTYYLALPGDGPEIELMGEAPSQPTHLEVLPFTQKEDCFVSSSENTDKETGDGEENRSITYTSNEASRTENSSLESEEDGTLGPKKGLSEMEEKSTRKGLYQDWHGTYHVAHQPPGYSSCMDSHQSGSTSDNEPRKSHRYRHRHTQELNDNDGGECDSEGARGNGHDLPPTVFSSTGSESAYETIRERHRNVGESLASSFEFYSTSPRDARLLGYVSDASKTNKCAQKEEAKLFSEVDNDVRLVESEVATGGGAVGRKIPLPPAPPYKFFEKEDLSSSSSCPTSSYTSRKATRKVYKKSKSPKKPHKGVPLECDRSSSGSSSVIRLEKQEYVKRITKYISTLEKLERTLMPSCDNLILEETRSQLFSSIRPTRKLTETPEEEVSSDQIGSSFSHFEERDMTVSTSSSACIVGNSFIVHDSAQQSSSSERRHETPTSRQVKETSLPDNTTAASAHGGLEGVSLISDFRKLMASSTVRGEPRPYRFLLQRAEKHLLDERVPEARTGSDISTPEYETKNEIPLSQPSIDTVEGMSKRESSSSIHPLDGGLAGRDSSTISPNDNQTFAKVSSRDSKVSSSRDRNLELFDAEGHSRERPSSVQKGCSKDSAATFRSSTESSPRRRKKENKTDSLAASQKRNFGQMFPSESFVETTTNKQLLSVGIQTGQSLLQLSSSDTSAQGSCGKADNKRGNETECGLIDVAQVIDVEGSQPPPPPPRASLQEIEARIETNAQKINDAISVYNKKFPEPFLRKGLYPAKNSSDTGKSSVIAEEAQNCYLPIKPVGEKELQRRTLTTTLPKSSSLEKSLQVSPHPDVDKVCEAESKGNTGKVGRTIPRADASAKARDKKSLKFTVLVNDAKKTESLNKSLVEELLELNKENEIMTLQEALSLARPSYVKEAERRRLKICRKQTLRQKIQAHNKDVLAELPHNLKTPKVLQKFMYKPDESPLFSYKAMRQQTKRLYQMLPEAQTRIDQRRKKGAISTNRVMAQFYSKKLQKKTLKGKISHTHSEVVTPLR